MSVDVSRLAVEVQSKGIAETDAALTHLTKTGSTAELSFTDLAKKVAGYTTMADLAVRGTQKAISVIKDLAVQSVQLAASFEKSRMVWGVLVNDMDSGAEVFEKIRQFAARTPMSFEALNQAATTVKGFGVETEDLIPTLSKLGDIAMGDNGKLNQLALVFGQVKAQGRAMTQDLYQFVNARVPIFQLLAEVTDSSAGEVKELAAAGKIGYAEIASAIDTATSSGGMFYQMMEKTATTTSGKWSTAVDNWKASLADLGEKVLPAVNAALDEFNRRVEKNQNRKNLLSVLNTNGGEGDVKSALAYAKLEQSRGLLSDYAWGDLSDEISRLEKLYQNLVASESRRTMNRQMQDAGVSSLSGNYTNQRTWQSWEDEADQAVAARFKAIEREAATANSLGREYDVDGERDKVINEWIDFLLKLAPSQTNEVFSEKDRSIQELVAQLSTRTASSGVTALNELAPLNFANFSLDLTTITDTVSGLSRTLSDLDPFMAPGSTGLTGLATNAAAPDTQLAKPSERGIELTNQYADANVVLQRRLSEVEELYKSGQIDAGTYARAMGDIQSQIENLDPAMVSFKDSLGGITDYFGQLGQQAFIDSFEAIGEAFVSGKDGASSFADSMKDLAESILNNLPLMLLQAGLNAMSTGPQGFYVGLGLIAASGLVAIGNGIYNASSSSSSEDNANGGVYASRSLHHYANGIYSSPQLFNFANGSAIGRFAEAGIEAIMPLTRIGGKLGVLATGSSGGNVQVIVNNNAPNTTATTTETVGPDGLRQVRVMVKGLVKQGFANGEFDRSMSSRYGARAMGVRK